MCEEHKIRCRHEFISPFFSLKIFAHENSQFSQLKRLGKHCAVSALSRRFLCAKLVFKYLVVMTSNYASSGPNQTERLRERKVEGQSIGGETGEEDGRRNLLGWHWSTEYMLCSSIVLCRLFQAWLNKQILKHFKHGNQHCQNRTQTEQLRPIKLTVYLRHDAMPCDAMRYDSSDCKWPKLYKMSMFDAELTDRQADRQGDGQTEAEPAQKRRDSLMNCWAAVQTASQLEIHVQRTFLFAALQFFRIVFANCCTQRNFFGDGIGIGLGKALCSVSQLTIFNKLIHIASAAQMSHNSCLVSLFSAFH